MTEGNPAPRNRFWGYVGKCIRLILAAALYALIMWYGLEAAKNIGTPPVLTKIAVVLISLGVAGSTYNILVQVFDEIKGGAMVLAEFLNRKLLEPQKRQAQERLKKAHAEGLEEGREEGREKGREEGRAETIAKGRARLIERGIDPDLAFPLEGEIGDDAASDSSS